MMQTIAWGSMLIAFSSNGSLAEAVDKTFDGEHPCELCKLVKETKREEDKKPVSMVMKKQDVVLSVQIKAPVPRGTDYVAGFTPYERWIPEGIVDELLRPPRMA